MSVACVDGNEAAARVAYALSEVAAIYPIAVFPAAGTGGHHRGGRHPTQTGFDARVVDASGRVLVRLSGYDTVELPGGVEDRSVGPLREAMS